MKFNLTSVFVDDQDAALTFYTDILGFVKKTDLPVGDAKWLTVVSPEGHDDVELLLEPGGNPAAVEFRRSLREQQIPSHAFASDDVHAEVELLKGRGVRFTMEPTDIGDAIVAVFDDTCGNLIQMYQQK